MTREEAITVLKGLSDNPLFSNQHRAAFNIAIHDIKARYDWAINNLILINKDNYEPLEQEPKTGHWIETHDDWGNGIITDRKYKCSVCHGKHIDPEMGEWHEVFDYKYPFCPNCGVKMAESEDQDGQTSN